GPRRHGPFVNDGHQGGWRSMAMRAWVDDHPVGRRHVVPREHTHNRWNRDLPPVLHARSGDVIEFLTIAADDRQIDPTRPSLDFDRGRVHPLTGPVAIEGAEPGDVLEVRILDVDVSDWGWQTVTQ